VADAWDLSASFTENHAADAARVLEALSAAEADAFLERLTPALAARVLQTMLPTTAARLLQGLTEAVARAVLNAANTQSAVAMLRHVAEPARSQLISGLAPAAALAAQLLLGFPDGTVGAWTDPDVVTAEPQMPVAGVLSRIRATGTANLQHVYVTDHERRLLGRVGMDALLRAAPADALVHCMDPAPATLSVLMPVASARDLPAWERAVALPVVDHDMRLIGVLRRSALVQGLRSQPRPASQTQQAGMLIETLAASYWGIVSALSHATIGLLPAVKRVLPEE